MPCTLLFVYGTLRRSGAARDLLTRAAVFAGEARVAGRLYDLGSYPGMVKADDHYVAGELYAIGEDEFGDVIAALDAYEGCAADDPRPHEYCRALVRAERQDGSVVEAWAYLLTRPVNGLSEIESGDHFASR